MRGDNNQRLTILSEAEKTALYGTPQFDDFQRLEFFALTEAELALALGRKSGSVALVEYGRRGCVFHAPIKWPGYRTDLLRTRLTHWGIPSAPS